MAKLSFSTGPGFPTVDMLNIKNGIADLAYDYDYVWRKADGISFVDNDQNYLSFRGTGFLYDLTGKPVAGIITSVEAKAGGVTVTDVSGLSLHAGIFASYIIAMQSVPAFLMLMAGNDEINGTGGADRLLGEAGNDTMFGYNGSDTLDGGTGDDVIIGGTSAADLRDVIYGGDGNDSIDGGYGNDELYGGADNDTILGGFGSDTLTGNEGNDWLSGGPLSDMLYGGPGDDTLDGGFGHDRMNGGAGADRFRHAGIPDHGSDWIQDYNAAEGDVLVMALVGATRDQFHLTLTNTAGAGQAGVNEAFITYIPTGKILWALVDGAAQEHINIMIGSQTYDLLAV